MVVDDSTVELARRGDAGALRLIFDTKHESVMSLCLCLTGGDREASKDLTQESFIRAFRSLNSLSDPARLEPWLYTIARNVCRDHLKRFARERDRLEAFAIERAMDIEPTEPVDAEARTRAVRELLAEVDDPRVKEIVELKYGEPEHTTRQIAEHLGIPHGTVTVKLMRFRAAAKRSLLRKLLDAGMSP